MILRALEAPSAAADAPTVPVWDAIQRSQLEAGRDCWMITQPSHAALSGEIAAALSPSAFGALDEPTIRAIALHDAGWGTPDARVIQQSQASMLKGTPVSFLKVPPDQTTEIWTGSIEAAQKASPLGGILVSEHFLAIARSPIAARDERMRPLVRRFEAQEATRQQKLRCKVVLPSEQIARLVAALQFCDLLSLYLCAGVREPVEFPQAVGGAPLKLHHIAETDEYQMHPSPLAERHGFSVAALRHPRPKQGPAAASLRFRIQ